MVGFIPALVPTPLLLQRFPPAGTTMAEVLTLNDLSLMPAAEQQWNTAGAGVVGKPLAGEAEAPATTAQQLLFVEVGPVVGAAVITGGGGRRGGGAGTAGHGTRTHDVRLY